MSNCILNVTDIFTSKTKKTMVWYFVTDMYHLNRKTCRKRGDRITVYDCVVEINCFGFYISISFIYTPE